MNLLSVENISKSYGDKVLFENISFGIDHNEKLALIAKNGAGKSTLISILKGKEIADSGKVTFRRDILVSFLDQEPQFDESKTVMDTLLNSENRLTKVIRNYEALLEATQHDPTPATLEKFDAAMNDMNELNAWDYETKVKEILFKLNITHLEQQISSLSGGQKKRVALAQVLINEPNLLIMDEPTNHLDVEMIEWLEYYLSSREISLLLVTHDRYFLDEVSDSIIEIDNHQLYSYKGNFSYYLEKKAERQANELSEIDKARNTYRKELEWMRRMPKARGTKAKSRITSFYEVEEKAKAKKQERRIEIQVKMSRLGGKILELVKVSKSYGDKKILDQFTYTFKKGEKIGIVGKNGVGKSTLLNIIMGLEQADSGKIQTGDTVVFGYYSQKGIQLKEDKRVIEVIKDFGEYIPLADGTKLGASQLLTRFNFPPDVQYSYVSRLSGGEKRRLYLMTVLIKNPNFLILDEPTNDLDILTLQTLEEFLMEFSGCVLIVTHDRYFMDKLADHVFAFEGNGEVKDFPGNYSEYREWKDEGGDDPEMSLSGAEKEDKSTTPKEISNQAEIKTDKKKLSFKEQRELEQLEKDIAQLEKLKSELENKMNGGITDHNELQKISEELSRVLSQLDEKSMRWLELQD
ncbi:MAG: ABC-F family ATP-binding cassette domain-containing protein [Bacteroidia bacterium]